MTRFTIEFDVNDDIDITILHETLLHLLATTQPANMTVSVKVQITQDETNQEPEEEPFQDATISSVEDTANNRLV